MRNDVDRIVLPLREFLFPCLKVNRINHESPFTSTQVIMSFQQNFLQKNTYAPKRGKNLGTKLLFMIHCRGKHYSQSLRHTAHSRYLQQNTYEDRMALCASLNDPQQELKLANLVSDISEYIY